jgi:hypothetical protein
MRQGILQREMNEGVSIYGWHAALNPGRGQMSLRYDPFEHFGQPWISFRTAKQKNLPRKVMTATKKRL